MPWILLLLAALFTAPLSAATLPGVPTANTDKNSASEPDVEQKERLMPHWPMCWPTTPPVRSSLTSCVKQPPRRRPTAPRR